MTAAVRMFVYPGVIPVLLGASTQLASNSMFLLKQPYVASAAITAGSSPITSSPSPPAAGNPCVLRVEVQKGSVVHYEITGAGIPTATVATTNSPTIEGHEMLDWGFGYQISILLAGSEA